jgi:sRNA-binding carbon storage regulator CsrA
MIGDDISVWVTSIVGDKVNLGIEAPDEVPVDRKEIFRRKRLFSNYLQQGNYDRARILVLTHSYTPSEDELSRLIQQSRNVGIPEISIRNLEIYQEQRRSHV